MKLATRCAGTCGKPLYDHPGKDGHARKMFRDSMCFTCWNQAHPKKLKKRRTVRPSAPETRFPLCAGGCGARIITDPRDSKTGRRLHHGAGMCKACLEQHVTTPRPELTEDEIAALALISRKLPPSDLDHVAHVLGLREAA